MMKKITLGLLLLFLLFPTLLLANGEIHSRHLTTADGLSNNSIRILYQDSKGFIWMGSLNGLNRYDGNSFRTFMPNHDEEGPLSLADRRVRTIKEDSNQYLWITTSADLVSCYDLKGDRFVDFTGCGEYTDQYSYLSVFPNEVWLWGRTLGCRRVVCQEGVFSSQAFGVEQGNLPTNRLYFVEQDAAGRVWIGTDKGLYCWQEEMMHTVVARHAFLRMHAFADAVCFVSSDGSIWQASSTQRDVSPVAKIPDVSTAQDIPGHLAIDNRWILFTSKGGYLYHLQTRKLEVAPRQWNIPGGEVFTDNFGDYYIHNGTGRLHYVKVATGETISIEVMPSRMAALADMERYAVVRGTDEVLWISTYGNGLLSYDLRSGHLSRYQAGENRSSLIVSDAMMCVMMDRSGSLWIGSEYAGVTQLSTIHKGAFQFYPAPAALDEGNSNANKIRLITALGNGDIYMATRDGNGYTYDATLSTCLDRQSYAKNVYALCQDSDGTCWLGTRGDGLYVGDRHYRHQPEDSTSLPAQHIFCLLRDSHNRMWVGTFGGGLALAVPDGKGGYIFRRFFTESYGERRIRSLIEDANGWFWMGTSEGLIVFHPDKLLNNAPDAYYRYNSENHSLQSNEVRHILQDSRGNFYIAETGAGFSICTPGAYDNLSFTHYGTENGLVNNMVQTFIEDAAGNVWIATEYGISCFTPASDNFENFFFSGNVSGNIYSENSALRLADGRLLMGTSKGALLFAPERVQADVHKPLVTFTNLRLNGIVSRPEETGSPLQQSIAYTKEIHLAHNQNSFTINFSTLDYALPTACKYSCLLENYDERWSQPDVLSAVGYKNLSPGTYRLRVRAISPSGHWGDEAVLKIIVSPPYWKTWYAYLIYIVLIVSGCFFLYRIFRNINELRNKIKVEEQLTEYKLVFFTNISHEFRTPLTLIQAALEKMHQQKIPAVMTDSVEVMTKSTNRMLRLINQLLEFRKMQNNKLSLSLEETDIIAFLSEIWLSFKDAAEARKMEFVFQPSIPSYRMFIDKGNVDKVVYNLLSNALKYTPSGGRITLAVQADGVSRRLIIRVTDTGVGIPKEKQNQLFSRFMQSNFARNSTGIGLHLTQELVNVHKGTIRFEENPQGGSIFTVTLPLTPSEYEEKDFLVPGSVLLSGEEEQHNEESFEVDETTIDVEKSLLPPPY